MIEYILIVVLAGGGEIRKPATAHDCAMSIAGFDLATSRGSRMAARETVPGAKWQTVASVRCERRQPVPTS